KISPLNDIDIINLELMLSDFEIIENRLNKVEKLVKGDKSYKKEYELLDRLKNAIDNNKPLRNIEFDQEEISLIKSFGLLSLKPVLYVCNVSEEDLLNQEHNEYVNQVKEYAKKENSEVVVISG